MSQFPRYEGTGLKLHYCLSQPLPQVTILCYEGTGLKLLNKPVFFHNSPLVTIPLLWGTGLKPKTNPKRSPLLRHTPRYEWDSIETQMFLTTRINRHNSRYEGIDWNKTNSEISKASNVTIPRYEGLITQYLEIDCKDRKYNFSLWGLIKT